MDKVKLIVEKTDGLKMSRYKKEYPASELEALSTFVRWIVKLGLFDSIIIYRKDNLHVTNK